MGHLFKAIIVVVCYLGGTSNLLAASYESYQSLNQLAVEFIQSHAQLGQDERTTIRLGNAVNDLRLAKCTTPITVNIPASSAEQQITTLEMTCSSQPSWHVYVPVDMKILTRVVVARETIPAKTIISEDMLDLAYRDKNVLYSGYFRNFSDISGQISMMTMIKGTVINHKNIQQPILINRNQNVTIESRHGHILIRAEGIAKSSGALNDTIKVLNPSSKRIVDAVVISSSTVAVGV